MANSDNTYAMFLELRGFDVVHCDSIDWFVYQNFLMPAYFPHKVPQITNTQARLALKKTRCPFARWDSNFNEGKDMPWWYILKKGLWDINDVKDGKKRRRIRQGIKNFSVRVLNRAEIENLCWPVAQAAASRYKVSKNVEGKKDFDNILKTFDAFPDKIEFYGCFDNEKLVSFTENWLDGNAVWVYSIRHDPEYLKRYSSYALFNGLLTYYLNEKRSNYIFDGCRNIHHVTQIQDYLIKVFNFEKIDSKLNVEYSTWFKPFVHMAYPFSTAFSYAYKKTNSTFLLNVNAVLKQHDIFKKCK
jgi:hypothetical protein